MRVYFDTSVIIAAILSAKGGSAQLLTYHKLAVIRGIISQTVIDELLEKTSKLKKTKYELEKFIAESGLLVYKRISSEEIKIYRGMVDTEDLHIIAGAKRTKCTHLVTLDKRHLLRPEIQKKFTPLAIVSPRELLEKIVSKAAADQQTHLK